MKVSMVSLLILLGEKDMMAGSSLLTTWLGIARGTERFPIPGGGEMIFSTGDDIIYNSWKCYEHRLSSLLLIICKLGKSQVQGCNF